MSVFIAAECGVNHLGDRSKMLALCDAAKQAGADAVKFQAYNAEELVKRRGKGDLALLKQCELSDADLDAIAAHCKAIGLKHFYSVFDPSQVERVLSRGACCLKIGHAEADWFELLMACRRSFRRVYVSNLPLYLHGKGENVLEVFCCGEYPAKTPSLRHVGMWRGFSSHYQDYRIPAAAALRGAEYIEAHLKLSDTDPEAAWSLSADHFSEMVRLIREYETWL